MKTCTQCQRHADSPTIDHFRPIDKGGEHHIDNVVPACRACNNLKNRKLVFEWVPKFERSGRLARHAGKAA